VDVVCNTVGDVESHEFPFAVFPVVDKINFVHDCSVNVRLSPLQYTDVFVNGLQCRALKDSGTQLSLISQAVCEQLKAEVSVSTFNCKVWSVTPFGLLWLMCA